MPNLRQRKRSDADSRIAGLSKAREESGRCPDCGLLYIRHSAADERYHRTFHDERLNGRKSKLGDGFYAVTQKSRMWLQRLAQAAAIAARRDTGYDFPSFVASKETDDSKTIAIIYVCESRVIALIVSREHLCEQHAPMSSLITSLSSSRRRAGVSRVKPHPRRAIEMIWVLKKGRRKGVARRLIDALAVECGIRIKDFAHMTPFTEDAEAFWKSCGLSTVYVV